MAFIPVPNAAEVQIRGTLNGEKVENTLWFEDTSGWSTSTLTTLASDVQAWYIANVIPAISVGYNLTEVFAKDQSVAAGANATVTPASGTPGGSGPPVPNNGTITISFRTALGGRSFRGRNYIPGIPTSALDSPNSVNGSFITALQTAYNKLLLSSVITNGTWVVASKFSGVNPVTKKPIPRTTGIVTPITAALFTDRILDSQRRRLPGRGA